MRRYGFPIFLVITFAIAIPVFVASTQQSSPAVITFLLLIGSYAPAVGGWFVIRQANREEMPAFVSSLRKQAGGYWIWFAVLVPTIVWLASFGVSTALQDVPQPSWLLLAALPLILLVNYGEEIGWRGYALPFLLKRFNPFIASLLLGGIWVLFHAPLYWQRPFFGVLASIIILFISVMLTWLYVNTGSILPGALFHAVFNAWTQVFAGGPGAETLLFTVIILCGGLTLGLLYRSGTNLAVSQ